MVGRAYVALSLALLPVVVVVLAVIVGSFRENGPQSAGSGPLALIALTILAIAGANALLVGLLAWSVPAARPTWRRIGLTTLVLLGCATVGLVLLRVL